MTLLTTIVIGFVVGLIARALMPGRQGMGIILTTLIGMGGAVVGSYGGQLLGLYGPGQTAGWIASVIGAMILLWIYAVLR
ncbi:MAG: GlsB/YeaQ/YmgE family stress response membrane protein [Ottowia sp.]|nr:GlsB/YeaQ/YmgE family stress response membrane protein [Ottowia sp.]